MTKYILLTVTLFLFSYANGIQKKEEQELNIIETSIDSVAVPTELEEVATIEKIVLSEEEELKDSKAAIDTSIVNAIDKYYTLKFKEKAFSKEIQDSVLVYNYSHTEYYNGEIDEVLVVYITIPINKSINLYGSNPILFGDLNQDSKKDLVVSVHREGGWVDGYNWAQDIFVFITTKGSYKLKTVVTDWEIGSECGGIFRAKSIKDNMILGINTCYSKDDVPSNPTIEYLAKLKYQNGKIIFHSKKRIQD